jgi:hypothetical protein
MLHFKYAQRRSFRRNNMEDTVLTLSVDAAGAAAQPSYLEGHKPVSSETLLTRILDSLAEDKAEDIVDIDLRQNRDRGLYGDCLGALYAASRGAGRKIDRPVEARVWTPVQNRRQKHR